MKFSELGLSRELLEQIDKLGFKEPTKIQKDSIPYMLEGKDVIGESATGSGKTLAFGCGVIEKTLPNKGLQSLILAPTRELVEQVKDTLFKITKNLRVITIYGGVSINPQISSLRNAEIVVATPGRLLDHLERGTIDLSKIKVLVLDEADRMLDMGFINDVEKIIKQCPKDKQTLFFSATIPFELKKITMRYMKDPVKIIAEKQVDASKLKQIYYEVPRKMKFSLLVHLLNQEDSGLVMVFCNTRKMTDIVVKNLKANDISATAIHGGLSQNKRTNTLKKFNNAKVEVLVCTDVAARGLHIDSVSHVYNYDIPNDPKDYVHRIGRTARAGEEGIAINLLSQYDYDNFSRVLNEYHNYDVQKIEKPYIKEAKQIKDSNQERGSRHPRRTGNFRKGNRNNQRSNNNGRSSGNPRRRSPRR